MLKVPFIIIQSDNTCTDFLDNFRSLFPNPFEKYGVYFQNKLFVQ